MTEEQEVIYQQPNFQEELKRPRLIAFLFATGHQVLPDNTVVLSGIFDTVSATSGDTDRSMKISVFVRIAQAFDEEIYIHFYSPTGELVEGIELIPPKNAVLEEGQPNYIQVARTFTFTFYDLGIYWFDVQYKRESLGMVPLFVKEV